VRPRLLLTVQGDTSTTMLQPLAELGDICRRHEVLFYTDATASLAGNALETDAWGWMRYRQGCRNASAARPEPRRLPSARAWRR
jgi:(S)-ureidoglycine-glyoxylate aminotransferase